jgi:hypothetical protein
MNRLLEGVRRERILAVTVCDCHADDEIGVWFQTRTKVWESARNLNRPQGSEVSANRRHDRALFFEEA